VRILVVDGPNLNMLGVREPHLYGSLSLEDVRQRLEDLARDLGEDIELEFFQSNHEGALVDRIHAGHGTGLAGCILNPGGLTQFSVSVADAIKAVDYPVIEVHLTNLHRREEWRQHSIISPAAVGVIQGLGWHGYGAALRYIAAHARGQT
jgi:3-dehydroquinate dehydratase II